MITINPTYEWNDEQEKYILVSHDGQYDAEPTMLFDRAAQKAARQETTTAGAQASQYGGQAGAERAPLQAYDTQNLENPQGIGQQGVHELLTAAEAGSGGTSSSLVGAEQLAAKRGTTGENTAMLDELARQRGKAVASASEGIAGQDVVLKQQQREKAADDLSRRYGIDVNAQLGQGNLQDKSINTTLAAGKTGWFQNLMSGISTISGAAKSAAGAYSDYENA